MGPGEGPRGPVPEWVHRMVQGWTKRVPYWPQDPRMKPAWPPPLGVPLLCPRRDPTHTHARTPAPTERQVEFQN